MDITLKTYHEEDPADEFHKTDMFKTYIKHFNDVQQELVKNNPKGWQDEFENRIGHFANEAGKRHGTHVEVEDIDDGKLINVYSPYAARSMGKLPMSHRTPKERADREKQETLSHEQFKQAVEDRLMRATERMQEAGLEGNLFGEGYYTVDPDAEDPKDIYRPA